MSNRVGINTKLKSTLLTLLSCALLATSAKAILYSDVDIFNGLSGRLLTTTNPIYDSFQIIDKGYDPSTKKVDSGFISFLLYDDSFMDGQERVTINLGSDPFATENSAQSADYLYLFAVDGVSGSALFDLSANGVLNYSIVANRGDFLALSATLTVNASPKGYLTVDRQRPSLESASLESIRFSGSGSWR